MEKLFLESTKSAINEECLVTFIDFLGFKNLLDESETSLNKASGILKETIATIGTGKTAQSFGSVNVESDTFSVIMSDSIVRVRPFLTYAPVFMNL